MSVSDDDVVDNRLRESVVDVTPPAVELRLRARMAEFRARTLPREHRTRWTPWLRLGLTCAAALFLVAVLGPWLRPRASFAEVAAAVLERPWVHLRMTEAGGSQSDLWFSPARNIAATRRPEAIAYEDYRLQIVDSYVAEEGVVYRAPIVWRSRVRYHESAIEALRTLFQGEKPPEQPLAHLDFLGPERSALRVLQQQVERVTEAGRAWLDYRLTVADPESGKPLRMLFRVDAESKLPSLYRVEGEREGKPVSVEARFDYPDAGPADVFDLGAPRTAKRIDRVPAGDVKRILETLRAGRERMDDYRAVFVMTLDQPESRWWTQSPVIFYRKGTSFRSDYPFGETGKPVVLERPDPNEDLGKWWRERIRSLRYYTQYVVRGTTTFTSDVKFTSDRAGTTQAEIASVLRTESGNNPGEDFPPEWSMRPEFACRPPMGLGNFHFEPVLDLHPAGGPPGCILLSVRHTSAQGRINEQGVGIADGYRYWLDPGRDYVVMRWDQVTRDASGRETIIESTITEETARSPQGVWYATRVRRHFPGADGKEKSPDQVYRLVVEFKPDLPGGFFEPPVTGKVL